MTPDSSSQLTKLLVRRWSERPPSVKYPFPETTDFSAMLVSAQASGAKVLGLANAGGDTEN